MLNDANVMATLPTKDLDAAKEFYEQKLGLEQVKEEAEGVTYQSGSSQLLVYASRYAGSNQATAASWQVDDVTSCVQQLKGQGIIFEQYDDLPGATREGDIHILDNVRAAWFKDPDGNILNVASRD